MTFTGFSPETHSRPSFVLKDPANCYTLRKNPLSSSEIATLIGQIYYSPKYYSQNFEYRHVIIPPELYRYIPSDLKKILLNETDWRFIGLQMSEGWVHYAIHDPEPNILLFKRLVDEKECLLEGTVESPCKRKSLNFASKITIKDELEDASEEEIMNNDIDSNNDDGYASLAELVHLPASRREIPEPPSKGKPRVKEHLTTLSNIELAELKRKSMPEEAPEGLDLELKKRYSLRKRRKSKTRKFEL